MSRNIGYYTEVERGHGNSSKIEPKRSHQWLNDRLELSNKRQNTEAVNSRPLSEIPLQGSFPWDTPNFRSGSGHFVSYISGLDPAHNINLVNRDTTLTGTENMHTGRKGFEGHFGNDSSVNLIMSHNMNDLTSCLSVEKYNKVNTNQVRDLNDDLSASFGHSFSWADNAIAMSNPDSNNTAVSRTTCSNMDENPITVNSTLTKTGNSFMLMGHTLNKEDGRSISCHDYSREDDNVLSLGRSHKDQDMNLMPSLASYDNGFLTCPIYCRTNEKLLMTGQSYSKETNNTVNLGSTVVNASCSIISSDCYHGEIDSSLSNRTAFGGFHSLAVANQSDGTSDNNNLANNQYGVPASEVPGEKDEVNSDAVPLPNSNIESHCKISAGSKKKEPKSSRKDSSNCFPSNVKCLLSTGILDGVHVKYSPWTREKSLHGIIKGTQYLCGCKDCKFNKALNAYEFESHANCKTRHPNGNIYFKNGKTIYQICQELQNTPQDKLFDTVQNITGSTINQKHFQKWKESYLAAARELERIYGKDNIESPN